MDIETANAIADEEPFFLTQQNTARPLAQVRSANGESFGLLHRNDTENEDLRGVIDDLTIENKRLKHLLKNAPGNKKTFTSSPDKILEIRTHGLPPDKKRELEQLLKKFTLGITEASPSFATDFIDPASNHAGSKATLPTTTTSAIDSGYASNTTSAVKPASNATDPVTHGNRDREIKDYLHDIPNSLLPKSTLAINEDARMALVVQRLEQLFLGKSAVPGEHSFSVQQQKISRSAARADRREDMKQNRAISGKGLREAMMLPHDTKAVLELGGDECNSGPADVKPKHDPGSESTSDAAGASEDSSPSQRPTRPLDLDIERAQIVEDNINYIRHLGFTTPPESHSGDKKEQPWIFLNLLVGMAQLHTLNVTPAFIRKALKKLSSRFEISEDQQKIRWKGSYGENSDAPLQQSPSLGTQSMSDHPGDETGGRSRRSATSTLNGQNSMSTVEGRVARNGNSKSMHSSNSTLPKSGLSSHPSRSSAFGYKPIVYKGKRSHVTRSYLDSPSLSESDTPRSKRAGNGASPRVARSNKDDHEGVVTFFNHSFFCEDLSGDGDLSNGDSEPFVASKNVLGLGDAFFLENDNLRDPQACYFNHGDGSQDQVEDFPEGYYSELNISLGTITSAGEDETQPPELPASGIGGVKPEENFAIDVKILRTREQLLPQSKAPLWRGCGITKRPRSSFRYQIIGYQKLDLRPSRLPPPSYIFFTSSSTSGADGGIGSSSSSDTSSEADESAAPAGYMWQWTSSSQEVLGEEEDSDSISGDSLMSDVIQTGQEIQRNSAQEQEDMVFQPQRIVSGSLVATVGASCSAASMGDRQ
ncbi:hypothetical protein LTR84_007586 [Exophiala bonariae]|uniref:Frequency clock protein n=1 Tax=Exophiala bonariae TaxID=1690606 RepID=A0AAV9NKV1_9EURO|nr:hypothetical protein LTR84_007586 [Exophiala bonariae]